MSTIAIVVAIGILAAVLLMRGKKSKPSAAPMVRGNAPWRFHNSPGMPEAPSIGHGNVFSFGFPQSPQAAVHSVKGPPQSLIGASLIRAEFDVTGGGFIAPQATDGSALVSIMFQRKGDDLLSGVGEFVNYRWYALMSVPLVQGQSVLAIPLTDGNWTNVEGQHNPAGFAAAVADCEAIYITFGHSSGRAHGVYASEPSAFALNVISII